ncbi:uncharacterized protein F4812DRAFT_44459 [Daldinia caldariorum]|uniref:uncharacterized protein n=1 Tax=Daldinia caldariorum TaxID=326644 RepID=UPI00200858A2|nr:uncharacterized protein F4812DRAFT_44459 [Daldinia caldariorum]KAI1473267.1 hypothetical protein F4812DRAFT_44459 [Daldinia caldariorum]
MRFTLAFVSALLGTAIAAPQGVTNKLTPTGAAPAGCTGTFDGKFEISVAEVTEKRGISQPQKRAECGSDGVLVLTLKDGSTFDAKDRTGYIASNFQFQFDAPAQAGALYTNGFSLCENNILALGDSKTFYRCLSGDFYNLYDRDWAPQCSPVSIIAVPCGSDDPASQIPDGQVVGTSVVQTTIVTALPDGQPQVITTSVPVPICQIGDGQVQQVTTPCASITSSPTSTYVPVSEYTDGQVQVTPPGSAPAPPATPTATPTPGSPAPPAPSVPVSSASAPSAPAPSVPAPSSSSGSTPSTSVSESVSSSASVSLPASSSSPSPSAPSETTAPPQSGSSRVSVGSIGALVFTAMVACFYL